MGEKDIDLLKNELEELKSRIHFWKTIALILLIDIPLMTAIALNINGIGEMNYKNLDLYSIRYSSIISLFGSIITILVSNIYLVFKKDC